MATELEAARDNYTLLRNHRIKHTKDGFPVYFNLRWEVQAAETLIPALEAELARTNALLDDALGWLDGHGWRVAVVQGRLVVTAKAEKAGGA